jgi:hypothetical protein
MRNIPDGMLIILHEALHEIHTKKLNDVILKLDFELILKKTYDKVK